MAQKGLQKEQGQNIDSLCVPLPADHISWENEGESFRVYGLPRWGEDPRALRPLRGDRRIHWTQAWWSIADFIEQAFAFDRMRRIFRG